MVIDSAAEPRQKRSIVTRRRLMDAAVAELVENGYPAVTTVSVARRAHVTRGAQQHHFPNKEVLVAEAIRHLSALSREQLAEQVAALPRGKRRTADALDLVFQQYRGPFFVAMFELSLASRRDAELAKLVSAEEQRVAQTIYDLGREVLGAPALATAEIAARWGLTLSLIRGIAVLGMLGHSDRAVDRQWRFARSEVIASFTA